MFLHWCPFFYEDKRNMSFHGNQIGAMVPILLEKKRSIEWIKLECFWIILSTYNYWILHKRISLR